MSWHPGERLRLLSKDYPELCFYCTTPASVTLRGGVRVCPQHAEAMSTSNYVIALLLGLAVLTCLAWFAVSALHRAPEQLLLSGFVGVACAFGSVVSWRDSR